LNEKKDLTKFVVTKTHSENLGRFLADNGVSLAITSYQSGRVYLVGSDEDQNVTFFERIFERAMGLYADKWRLILGGLHNLIRFENVLGYDQVIHGKFDACYLPRNTQTTGNLDIHELNMDYQGRIIFVNTKYSCLAELNIKHSFKPIWVPDFISELKGQDRCHLNGMAMFDGRPTFVTACGTGNEAGQWREHRRNGGVVIDIRNNKIVCRDLSMPHSPRVYNERLWVLNSGEGQLGYVNLKEREFVPVQFFPGFLRGFDTFSDYGIFGLSKPRDGVFSGLHLQDELEHRDVEAWCGVQIFDMKNGELLHWIKFEGDVSEIFDVKFIPGVKNPMMVGQRTPEIRDLITIEK
jgi:uncharacterized protein (TIGR03032 family)